MSMNDVRDNNVRSAAPEATSKTAPAKSLQHMVEIKMYAVEVGDEQGIRKQVMAFKVGNQWYVDPLGEQWMQRLRPLDKTAWLAKVLESRFKEAAAPLEVPKQDTVDIVG